MKIKKVRKKVSANSKLLAHYRNIYKNLPAIEINRIKRVETNGLLTEQTISTLCCPVFHHETGVPLETYLNPNTLPEDTSEQLQLPLSHGESNVVVLSSLTPVIQPEKEDQSTKDKVDPFFSSILEDLIQSTNSLKLDCIEASIDQETYEKKASQKGLHTAEPFSVIDNNYIPSAVSNLDTVASTIGGVDQFKEIHSTARSTFVTESYYTTKDVLDLTKEVDFIQDAGIDQFDDNNSTIGSTFVTESDYTTMDNLFEESNLTEEVDFTEDAGIDQVFSPTQEIDLSEKADSIEDYTKKYLILSYEQIVPDDSDPDFYCRVCNINSKDKASFYIHLTKNHKMILRPFSDWRVWDILTESHEEAPKSYCSECDIAFTENKSYLDHFGDTKFHKLNAKEIDIYKSTCFQCDKCSRMLKGLVSLCRHYNKIHKADLDIKEYSIQQSPTNNETVKKHPLRNQVKIKGSIDTIERSITKEKSQLKSVNKTKAKHILTTDYNTRRSTRKHNTNARTKTEPKLCKPRTQKLMFSENTKRSTRAAHFSSPRLAKINPGRICQLCNRVLSSLAACKNHIKRRHKALSTSESVESISTLSEKNDTNIKCVICGQIYTSKELLYTHFKNNHKIEATGKLCIVNILHCELCDIEFQSSLDLKNHMKKIHRLIKDKQRYAECYCVACNMAFKSMHGYNRHSVSEPHTRNTLVLKNTMAALSNSPPMSFEKTSTEVEEEDNILPSENLLNREHCNSCDITFYNKSSSLMHFFKIHKFSYTEVPEKEVFKRKPNLNMLLKNEVLPKENDPNLYCNVCRKKFSNEGNFKLHLVSIHEMVLKKDESKPVESNVSDKESIESNSSLCFNVCNKNFVSAKSSQEHILRFHRVEKRKSGVSFSNDKTTKQPKVTKVA
ncbi:hypothetical protein BDF21DRAFT_448724 [Thamnidium elegans]|nr:hypothetical protein BDF21DRAFT_448724 [Thamnidium elegans]